MNNLSPTITICSRKQDIDIAKLQDLFDVGAFWAQERTAEKLERMIANSNPVICAYDGEALIAFARATSDGVYRATIWDVVVHPQYQGKGVGRHLISELLNQPALVGVERVYLMTTFQQGFYEKLGFVKNTSTTMLLVSDGRQESDASPW